VLQVTVTAPDPAAAAARANAVADAYLTFRAQSALASAQPGIAALDARIAATNPKDVATLADLNAQRTALLDVGEGTGRVIGRASSPSSPSSLGLASYLVGGLVGGLLLGALAALLRDLFDRRVRFAARYSELVRERAVVVRGLGDVEAARWLVRGIRARAALRRPVVVVTALDGTSADEVFGAMRNLARRTGMDVHVVEAEPGTGTPDQQALYQGLENGAGDLLLVNATRIASPAEQALLADAADVVLVVASARSRVRDAADAQALFDDVAAGKLLPAYLERRGKARPEPAGRSAAERKPDLAASRR
jgi:uncharacterized protein involved in exopolysaccharide biosynthesis